MFHPPYYGRIIVVVMNILEAGIEDCSSLVKVCPHLYMFWQFDGVLHNCLIFPLKFLSHDNVCGTCGDSVVYCTTKFSRTIL